MANRVIANETRRKDLPKPIRRFHSVDVAKLNKDTLRKKLKRKARRLLRGFKAH